MNVAQIELRSSPPRRTVAAALLSLGCLFAPQAPAGDRAEKLHYAVNLAGDLAGVMEVGFNLADVSSASELDALPDGMRGVLWLGNGYNTNCAWRVSDAKAAAAVASVRDHPKFSGIYYISDEPHPTICPDAPQKVTERSALIRSLDPDGRTFILVQNSSREAGEFASMGASADLIGVDPYPCNHNNVDKGCDLKAMRDRIEAAMAAGIEPDRIVPVYQAFGQACAETASPYYRMPSVNEAKAMLAIWDELVPPDRRPFDMAYSWGPQPRSACPSLKMADGITYPDLLSVFTAYFAETQDPGLASAGHD